MVKEGLDSNIGKPCQEHVIDRLCGRYSGIPGGYLSSYWIRFDETYLTSLKRCSSFEMLSFAAAWPTMVEE